MSVRARYLLVIVGLILAVVATLAYFHGSRLLSTHLAAKNTAGNMVAANVFSLAQQAINTNPQKSAQDAIKEDAQVRAGLKQATAIITFPIWRFWLPMARNH
ncbi:MAG: hypothetical protein U0Y68_20080 [Blastocatellia bacterium]